MVSDIPVGDGKTANFFYSVLYKYCTYIGLKNINFYVNTLTNVLYKYSVHEY